MGLQLKARSPNFVRSRGVTNFGHFFLSSISFASVFSIPSCPPNCGLLAFVRATFQQVTRSSCNCLAPPLYAPLFRSIPSSLPPSLPPSFPLSLSLSLPVHARRSTRRCLCFTLVYKQLHLSIVAMVTTGVYVLSRRAQRLISCCNIVASVLLAL